MTDQFKFSMLNPARDCLFKQGKFDDAFELLNPFLNNKTLTPEEKKAVYQLAGLIRMKQLRFNEASGYFKQVDDAYMSGYCQLLMGEFQNIQGYWQPLLKSRINHWCIALFGLVTMQLNHYPTMFQVRNHLESDIGNLLAAGRDDMLKNLLSYVDLLTQVNLETPKFMGRALINNIDDTSDWLDEAGALLLKGQKTLPNDPEVYYHLGQYRLMKKQKEAAILVLNQCLMMNKDYTPAKDLLHKVKSA